MRSFGALLEATGILDASMTKMAKPLHDLYPSAKGVPDSTCFCLIGINAEKLKYQEVLRLVRINKPSKVLAILK